MFYFSLLDNQAFQGDISAEIPTVSYATATGGIVIGNPQQIEALNKVKSFVAQNFAGAFIVEERAVSIPFRFVFHY